jgi:endonuclease G, mitochondrial
MKKILISLLFIFAFVLPANSQPSNNLQDCRNIAPYGFPQIRLQNATEICRYSYALLYDNNARISPWTIYTLRSEHALGCIIRNNSFLIDPLIRREYRSNIQDYRHSGYDMGHLIPSGDMNWNQDAHRDSFFLSNISPQHPTLNRGIWRELEYTVRYWALSRGSLVVITGNIYNNSDHIGFNRVAVPDYIYKIITDISANQTLAFLAENTAYLGSNIRQLQSTVTEISRLSGIQFQIPDNPNFRRQLWNTNTRRLTHERSRVCAN